MLLVTTFGCTYKLCLWYHAAIVSNTPPPRSVVKCVSFDIKVEVISPSLECSASYTLYLGVILSLYNLCACYTFLFSTAEPLNKASHLSKINAESLGNQLKCASPFLLQDWMCFMKTKTYMHILWNILTMHINTKKYTRLWAGKPSPVSIIRALNYSPSSEIIINTAWRSEKPCSNLVCNTTCNQDPVDPVL